MSKQAVDELLSVAGAAKFLGISPNTMKKIVARGDITALRLPNGTKRWLRRDEVEALRHTWRRMKPRERPPKAPG